MIPGVRMITAQTPFGNVLFSDVSDTYTQKTARDIEALNYEREVGDIVLAGDYDRFVDVGAAFGYFSLMAASTKPREKVIAFEPHPLRYAYLWWNTKNNPTITIRNDLVGHRSVDVWTTNNINGLLGREVGSRVPDGHEHTYELLGDWIPSEIKTLIKIDVEGYEVGVIESSDPEHRYEHNWLIEIHTNLVSEEEVLSHFSGRTIEILLERDNTKNVYIH